MDALLSPRHHDLRTTLELAVLDGELDSVDRDAEAAERDSQDAFRAFALAVAKKLGNGGFFRHAVADVKTHKVDSRALCITREEVAWASGLCDTLIAMQGLGSYPVALAGTGQLRDDLLSDAASGKRIGAFAITEQGAGSDVSAIATRAVRNGDDYVLTGSKTFISNAGIADFYTIFARTGDGARGLTAFLVDGRAHGLSTAHAITVNAPHVIGELVLDNVAVPSGNRLGEEGEGLRLAMATLDRYRPSVGAAAVGFAQRALDDSVSRVKNRVQFGRPLSEYQATQMRLAEMATDLEAARALVYRAAHAADEATARGDGHRTTREASMAKLFATEAAQRIVDAAVQLHGGLGVVRGVTVERLYREVRALRIYEGTSEIQKLVIARDLLK